MRHLIQKQQFLLELEPGLDAFMYQHAASRYYREKLLPLLERIFNELSGEDEVIQLDHCYIDLGVIGTAELQNGDVDGSLYQLIKAEVGRAIEKAVTRHPAVRTGMRESVLTRWWYYMEHGRLPWNADRLTADDLRQVLELFSVDYAVITRLRDVLRNDLVFLQRVEAQHDEWFLEKLVAVLVSSKQDGLAETVKVISRVYRLLEEKYRAATRNVTAETAAERELVAALKTWAARMTGFVHAPAYEKKGILWRRILKAAAERPAGFARTGGLEVLLEALPENVVALISSSLDLFPEPAARAFSARLRKTEANPASEPHPHDEPHPLSQSPDLRQETPGSTDKFTDNRSDVAASGAPGTQTTAAAPGISAEAESAPAHPPAATPDDTPREALPPAAPVEKAVSGGEEVFKREQVEEGGLYLPNAGLILVHPFLSTFFHRTGCWDGSGFISLQVRQKAILLLHFLATGEHNPPEYLLVMPKLLCGYALEMPMPREMGLTEEECAEATVLLGNVVKRWEKLGSTTIAGLQEGFLQRNGKLSNKEGRLQLQMETSGIDVLLDYLPWNLQLVKLPWLKDILYVEWR